MIQERDVLENAESELFNSTRENYIFFLCAVEIKKEPVR